MKKYYIDIFMLTLLCLLSGCQPPVFSHPDFIDISKINTAQLKRVPFGIEAPANVENAEQVGITLHHLTNYDNIPPREVSIYLKDSGIRLAYFKLNDIKSTYLTLNIRIPHSTTIVAIVTLENRETLLSEVSMRVGCCYDEV